MFTWRNLFELGQIRLNSAKTFWLPGGKLANIAI
jgi:hypothetical protein